MGLNIIVGLVLIAAGACLFWYELGKFKKKDAPTALKVVEALIVSFFWVAVPMMILGLLITGQGIKDLLQ